MKEIRLLHQKIKQELINQSDPAVEKSGQKFFKGEIKLHGVKNPIVHKISKDYFKAHKDWTKADIFKLSEELWKSGYTEEGIIACDLSYFVRKKYETADFELFETWVGSYVSNWATCDTFCNHSVGTFIDMYPDYLVRLRSWTQSTNRWLKRGAAVSLVVPARRGKFLPDIFQIADLLLTDSDDMVQKGYGWMLKEASKVHQQEVFDYVVQNKSRMPRTALRYAIEKMPVELKEEAMQK